MQLDLSKSRGRDRWLDGGEVKHPINGNLRFFQRLNEESTLALNFDDFMSLDLYAQLSQHRWRLIAYGECPSRVDDSLHDRHLEWYVTSERPDAEVAA